MRTRKPCTGECFFDGFFNSSNFSQKFYNTQVRRRTVRRSKKCKIDADISQKPQHPSKEMTVFALKKIFTKKIATIC